MTQNLDLEIKVIKKFVVNAKQDRYIQFISSPKKRHKFIRDLAHFEHLKWDLFQEIAAYQHQTVIDALRQNNVASESCYVISEDHKLDAKTLDLETALQKTIGYGMGTILVFGDAAIILYEGESIKSSYISKFAS